MEKITIVQTDDWMGIYIGDTLITENHNISLIDGLDYLGISTEIKFREDLEKYGHRLPRNLKDLQ